MEGLQAKVECGAGFNDANNGFWYSCRRVEPMETAGRALFPFSLQGADQFKQALDGKKNYEVSLELSRWVHVTTCAIYFMMLPRGYHVIILVQDKYSDYAKK